MSVSKELIDLRYEEPTLLAVNTFLRRLQNKAPITAVRTIPGDEAWLVTGHDVIQELTSDRRLGRTHPDPANAPRYLENPMVNAVLENSYADEPETHSLQRMLLAPHFSRRKMEALRPRLAPLIAEAVARLAAQEPPANAHVEFSVPLTSQVLGELIGIPREDRENLLPLVHQTSSVVDNQIAENGRETLMDYMCRVAARRRAEPGGDILSTTVQSGMTDYQAAGIGVMLLFAAMKSTMTITTLGIALIGNNPVARDQLIADPELWKTALEEILRIAAHDLIMPHYAREDIEIADVTIRAGDLVLVAYGLANFDKGVFPAADEVDITRSPNPHMSFGHGMWHCTGAPLAKVYLEMAYPALLAALPTLRLAKPLEEQGRTTDTLGDGLEELLVTW